MDTISIISFTIGLMSFAGSIVFFTLGHSAEKANRVILDNINKAIKDWQSRIMESTIEIMESRPEIIAKRKSLENTKAKYDIVCNILEKIQYIIEQPFSKEDSIPQTARLNSLLDFIKDIVKSDIPPEVWAKIAEKESNKQPDQTNQGTNQPQRGK